MEYTFSSTIEDGFSVVYAPINYLGTGRQLKWNVSCVNGKASAVLLDTDDYAIINKKIYFVDKIYVSLDNCKLVLNEFLNKAGLQLEADNSGRYVIIGEQPFTITYMTARLKYAIGLYYLKDLNISGTEIESDGKKYYGYRCMATHFEYLTPVWYVISNMGTPVQASTLTDRYTLLYPAINVRIINTFSYEHPLCINNVEYITVSQASSLSNLRFQIVDSDLNPIKFLTPLYITVAVEEVAQDEQMIEAMMEQEQNPNFMKMFQTYIKKNTELMEQLLKKTEMGIAVEPELKPIEEHPQMNQPIMENKPCEKDNGVVMVDMPIKLDKVPIVEVYGEGNDDKTIEKEQGMEQLQDTNIEENQNKINEELSEVKE